MRQLLIKVDEAAMKDTNTIYCKSVLQDISIVLELIYSETIIWLVVLKPRHKEAFLKERYN